MDEIVEQAKAQLMMIEQIYDLKIINRDEVADFIASNVDNNRQVLTAIPVMVVNACSKKATGLYFRKDYI